MVCAHADCLFQFSAGTVPSLRAIYAVPMAPVENGGLEVRYANLNPAGSTLQGS